MGALSDLMGARLVNLRRAWKVREGGRYGYITLEVEAGSTYFIFYLLVGGAWKQLTFKKIAGDIRNYQTARSGAVVDVA
jgi:hypothetical protein